MESEDKRYKPSDNTPTETPRLRTTLDFSHGDEILVCPQCGFEYIHPIRVIVATGLDTTIVDSKGTCVHRAAYNWLAQKETEEGAKTVHAYQAATAESKMAENMRGVRIIIEYVGECQHQGIIILQFHKGNVYVEHEVLPYANDWETLWRT